MGVAITADTVEFTKIMVEANTAGRMAALQNHSDSLDSKPY